MRDHGFDSCLAFSDNKNLEIYLYFILFHVYFHHVSHGLSYIFASNFVPRSEASRQALLPPSHDGVRSVSVSRENLSLASLVDCRPSTYSIII